MAVNREVQMASELNYQTSQQRLADEYLANKAAEEFDIATGLGLVSNSRTNVELDPFAPAPLHDEQCPRVDPADFTDDVTDRLTFKDHEDLCSKCYEFGSVVAGFDPDICEECLRKSL